MADREERIIHERGSGSRTALIVVAVLAVLLVLFLIFGGAMSRDDGPSRVDIRETTIEAPEVRMPEVDVPDVELPEIDTPDIDTPTVNEQQQ
jgi:hypothetical protein